MQFDTINNDYIKSKPPKIFDLITYYFKNINKNM